MQTNDSLICIDWKEIEDLVSLFTTTNKESFDYIVTIARGGCIPAVLVSHKLNIRNVLVIDIKRTVSDAVNSDKHVPSLGFCSNSLADIRNKKVLLVDDIIGSGETLKFTLELLRSYSPKLLQSFILIHNENNYVKGNPLPDNIGRHVRGWVIFPWEK